MIWKRQQVQQLLLNASFLNILLVEQLVFVYNLCKLYEEFWKLFRTQLVDNMQILDKVSECNSVLASVFCMLANTNLR